MNFKTNKLILFCNRRITMQIARNWHDSEYVKSLLETVVIQSQNGELEEVDFKNISNYVIYSLGNYYRGNTIFVFQILVAFLYLITPVDLISDFIPAIGYLDDLMLLKMILDTYNGELMSFNKVKREMLDIKYMRVDPKVIAEFDVKPTEAIDLIIKDRKLEDVRGEQMINEMIAEREPLEIADYINIDVIEIIKYELFNYLLKSKNNEEQIDEELLTSLIQIPDIVSKKDITYFLKNIEEILEAQDFEFVSQKKGLFSTNGVTIKFDINKLIIPSQLNFVQIACDYNNLHQQVIEYKSALKTKMDYEHIVEIIDMSRQKHLFADTTIYFRIQLSEEFVTFKVDKLNKRVTFIASVDINSVLKDQLALLADIIKERVM